MKASLRIALAVAGTCLAARAEAQTVVVGPRANSIAAQPNAVVTVPIVADLTGSGGASLGSVSGQVTWRTATLQFAGASDGTAGSVVFNAADTASGVLRFAFASPGGATGVAVLLNVSLRVAGSPGDTATIGVSLSEAAAAQTFADLTPVVTPALFCTAGGRFGDIDGNDSLRSNDALYIVTNAVGLPIAPYTVVNGDVDADGRVDTRDALIVLTHVVGLPTPGFRVGQLNTYGCGIRPAASVVLQAPATALAVGDVVPLVATARDSTSAITNAAFQWLSRDTAVVRAGPGRVEAVGTGTTRVVVVVAPGVMDSATVTVGGARRVWYVDQALAATNTVENGSAQYPFSALQAAVDHAAADDTIRVAVASYGAGARIVRPLVILGDSAAAAIPSFGGAIMIDSLAGGTVHVERVRIADADEGVRAHGSGAGRIELAGVRVERSRRVGIGIHRFAELSLHHVGVEGAMGAGVSTDSTALVRLADVHVDAVSGPIGEGALEGLGLSVGHADSLLADSVSLRLGTVRLTAVGKVVLRRTSVTEAEAALIVGDSLGTVIFDTVTAGNSGGGTDDSPAVQLRMLPAGSVQLHAFNLGMLGRQGLLVEGGASATLRDVTLDGPGIPSGGTATQRFVAQFRGVPNVAIAQSWIGYGHVSVERACGGCGAAALRVDTTTFVKAPVSAYAMDTVLVRGADFSDGPSALLFVDTAAVVSVSNSVVRTAWPVPVMYGAAPSVSAAAAAATVIEFPPFAVTMLLVDSVRIVSTHVHDNAQGAVALAEVRAAALYGNTIENNHTYPFSYYGPVPRTLDFWAVRHGRLAQNLFVERDGLTRTAEVSFDTLVQASFVADSNTIRRALQGFYVYGSSGTNSVVLRGNRFEQAGLPTPVGTLASLATRSASVLDNTVDTSAANGPQVSVAVDSFVARGNVFLGVGAGFAVYGAGDSLVVAGNTVRCGPTVYYGEAPPIQRAAQSLYGSASITLSGGAARVDSNAVRGCRSGIRVGTGTSGQGATVRRNVVVPDSASGETGIIVEGSWFGSVIAENEVGPGGATTGAIVVSGSGSGIDSTLVVGNRVHDVWGLGIVVTGPASRTVLDADTVSDVRYSWASWPCNYISAGICVNTSGTGVRIRHSRLSGNRPHGIVVAAAGDTVRIDSTVVVGDSLSGLHFESPLPVVGRYNFFARNNIGIFGSGGAFVRMDSSVFQQNVQYGVSGAPLWEMTDNYWGDVNGPRCPVFCDLASTTGDQIVGLDSLGVFPVLSTSPATPTGVPPAFRASLRAVESALPRAPGATRAVRVAPREESRRPVPATWREGQP